VVTHAAQQMTVWHRQSLPLEVAVNISAKNIRDNALPDRLAQLCRNNLANPNSMLLELNETSAMNDMAQMMDVLTRLRVRGFKLSIDDFGTGCSSLVHLQRMPFSDMKIDRSFVTQMTQSRDSATIVEIIIELAHKLGRRSVATGVENQATLDQLVKLGCGAAQGYHLGAPTAAARIPELVRGYNPARARAMA
jgi:EAL domain-containing protein (putative c-di-GMP-specific phosphodiesterase class I)